MVKIGFYMCLVVIVVLLARDARQNQVIRAQHDALQAMAATKRIPCANLPPDPEHLPARIPRPQTLPL